MSHLYSRVPRRSKLMSNGFSAYVKLDIKKYNIPGSPGRQAPSRYAATRQGLWPKELYAYHSLGLLLGS